MISVRKIRPLRHIRRNSNSLNDSFPDPGIQLFKVLLRQRKYLRLPNSKNSTRLLFALEKLDYQCLYDYDIQRAKSISVLDSLSIRHFRLLQEKFGRSNDRADLDRVIEIGEMALRIATNRANGANVPEVLAGYLGARYKLDGDVEDLNRAVEISETIISCTRIELSAGFLKFLNRSGYSVDFLTDEKGWSHAQRTNQEEGGTSASLSRRNERASREDGSRSQGCRSKRSRSVQPSLATTGRRIAVTTSLGCPGGNS